MRWISHADVAADRILDAAAELFAARGVAAVGMAEVAEAAGCSRATLYRYFSSRDDLRVAFVHRAAQRIGANVLKDITAADRSADRLVVGAESTLRRVRADRTPAAGLRDHGTGIAMTIAQSSVVIEVVVSAMLGNPDDAEIVRRARWFVRLIVSLLAMPGEDEADERAQIELFVHAALADREVTP